jgi:molybdate transport system regulatory protein
VATITHGSAVSLGLKAGSTVIAMVKAPSVMVVTNCEGVRFSARNQLNGKITRIKPGAVNTEVTIDAQGLQVVAMVTQESTENLDLAVARRPRPCSRASQVVLAVLP